VKNHSLGRSRASDNGLAWAVGLPCAEVPTRAPIYGFFSFLKRAIAFACGERRIEGDAMPGTENKGRLRWIDAMSGF
jgi:hypothetical protein